jgi:hypothetical protein
MFYFDDITGQYSISGYLENPKQEDINNAQIAYSFVGNNSCTRYGRNYSVGRN